MSLDKNSVGGCPCCGVSVTEWLKRALPCGRSQDRVPAGADTKKTFRDVGDLLTMSFSAGLSKDSGSIHSINTIQRQEQHNNTP